jgi:hypothetical protein
MVLNSLQPKCLYVNMKIQSLLCGTYWKQNITHKGFDIYIRNCFSREQEVGLFVGYDIVLCYGRGGGSPSEENLKPKKRGCIKV